MRNRKLLATALFCALTAGTGRPARAGGEPVSVTVIPFSARGNADPVKAETLRAAVTKELSSALCVSVVPEPDVKTLLNDSGLEKKCAADSNACALEAAKAAKSHFIVVGDLMQSGQRQFVSLQMIRVSRTQTVYRQRVETLDAFLTEDIQTVSKHLASGFSCTKEERFTEPSNALKIVPLTARKARDETTASATKAPEPAAASGETMDKR